MGNDEEVEYNAILLSIEKSLLPTEILAEIRGELKKSISESQANEMLVWYESDLGKKITLAEEKSTSAEAYKKMVQEAQSLLADSERVEIAKRFDTLLGVTDMTIEIQKYTGIAVYCAIMSVMQPELPLNIEQIRAQVSSMGAQNNATIQQMIILSFVYSYQSIDKGELRKYEVFLANDSTAKFNKIVMSSMYNGFERSILNMADALAIIYRDKKQKNETF